MRSTQKGEYSLFSSIKIDQNASNIITIIADCKTLKRAKRYNFWILDIALLVNSIWSKIIGIWNLLEYLPQGLVVSPYPTSFCLVVGLYEVLPNHAPLIQNPSLNAPSFLSFNHSIPPPTTCSCHYHHVFFEPSLHPSPFLSRSVLVIPIHCKMKMMT